MNAIQKKFFLEKEADAWFDRNFRTIENFNVAEDKVWETITRYNIQPKECLEIGCSAGHRLHAWKKELPQSDFYGIEPSNKAVAYGKENFKSINLKIGTIDDLSLFDDNKFDTIIIGFLLYVLDRELLFKAVAEVDRILKNGGYLIIVDFQALKPVRVKYHHIKDAEAYSFKQKYENIFVSSCLYHLVDKKTLTHSLDNVRYDASKEYYDQYVI